jgi:DNA-binding HxlR family transcriptional regulator
MDRVVNEHTWCPVDLVLHIVGSKWTTAIVGNLVAGPQRPFQLSKALKGINPKTLTERLRDLEKWGLIDRQFFHEIPPRVEYSLTERGRELIPVLQVIRQLGEKWQDALDINVPPEFKQQCSNCFSQVEKDGVVPGARSINMSVEGVAGNGHNIPKIAGSKV